MSFRKISIVVLIILQLVRFGSAQSNPSIINLPQVVPPPADAASLGIYGSVPVSMYNGNPNIEVPIYEIKTPRLSLPISLNYNATGVKVDDVASWVGLEWSLNAGGVITRSVRGIDDFGNNGYYTTTVPDENSISPQNSWGFFALYIRHAQDAESDFYFYNFSTYSGKFFFDTSKVPVIVNYQQPLNITCIGPNGFIITNEKGDNYYFEAQETASSGDYAGYATAPPYTSSWYLSQIISFDKTDTINFTYTADALLEQDFESYSETIGPTYTGSLPDSYQISGHSYSTGEPFTRSNPLRLKEIDYKNGKTDFYSSATRSDGASVKLDSLISYNYNYANGRYNQLKKVVLNYDYYFTNQSNKPSISPSAYRLRLDSVGIYGTGGAFGGSYKFAYNPTMLPWIAGNGRDLFGYYNGAYSNTTLVPTQTNVLYNTQLYDVGGANRATNPSYIQAGILDTIYYPTGGHTVFTYEPNSYASSGDTTITTGTASAYGVTRERDTTLFTVPISVPAVATVYITPYNYPGVDTIPYVQLTDLTTGQIIFNQDLPNPNTGSQETAEISLNPGHTYQSIACAFNDGRIYAQISISYQQVNTNLQVAQGSGLRILQVADFDINNQFQRSELYKYGISECGYGTLATATNLFNTNTFQNTFSYVYLPANEPICALSPLTTQRETFQADCIYDAFTLSGAPVIYQQVAKYRVDSLYNNIGKSVFTYNFYQEVSSGAPQEYFDGSYVANTGWLGGQLLLQEDYANKGGVYWPVKRTFLSYLTSPGTQGTGLKIGFQDTYNCSPPTDSSDVLLDFHSLYYWFSYPIFSGSVLPFTSTEYDYDQNDTTSFVMATRQFGYDNMKHLQPTTIQTSLSDGTTLTMVNRYPAEVDSISGLTAGEIAAIDTLESRHNVVALVQSQNTRNGTPVNITRNDYQIWPGNLVLPDSVEMQNGGFNMEKRLQFFNYDSQGNILQQAKASDLNYTYIWDYGNEYPIAEIKNASQSNTAFTSFEADGTGNWTIPDTTRNRTVSMTGALSYNLTSGHTINKASLSSSTAYVVSYWSTGGSLSVNGSTGTAGTVVTTPSATWTYYEHQVTGATSISVSGIGTLDELRLFPKGSLMTTYTYTPLVGMTSQCSPTNYITYYNYDGLERLANIKDLRGNVIKTLNYHYQGH